MTLFRSLLTKISARRSAPMVDINADHVGFRPTGDPRLDLALSTHKRF